MTLPPGALVALYVSSAYLVLSAVLFSTNLRKSFDFRRAAIFLRFAFYEKFFISMGTVAIGLVLLDFHTAFTAPETLPLFPDVLIRVLVNLCVTALYLEFYRTIGLGKKPKVA
ncbi:MAG: hypothetical protein HY558_04255 [Euryarchaeota archaeon]|nr:hypothetical protein [Euryarchaeota archaeon]